MPDEDPTTEELRAAQLEEERDERQRARESDGGEDAQRHGRRAEKAAYLREKLDERAASESRDEE